MSAKSAISEVKRANRIHKRNVKKADKKKRDKAKYFEGKD